MTEGRDPFDFAGDPTTSTGSPYTPPGGSYGPPGEGVEPGDFVGSTPWQAGSTGSATRSLPHSSPWSGHPSSEPRIDQSLAGLDTTGHPPTVWMVAALALGAIGAIVALLFGTVPVIAFAAWAVAGPLAIGALAVYSRLDLRQRARPIYTSPSWISGLYTTTIVIIAVGVGMSAWRIAEWAGRL